MASEGAEALGFEPSARVLIVNCDDLGMHAAVNAGTIATRPTPRGGRSRRSSGCRRCWTPRPASCSPTARALGKPVVDHAFLDSFALDPADPAGKAATYERLLRELPARLSEWAVHPALATAQWQAIEPTGWRARATDHAFHTSARARDVLVEEGITVIDYRPLQRAWAATT